MFRLSNHRDNSMIFAVVAHAGPVVGTGTKKLAVPHHAYLSLPQLVHACSRQVSVLLVYWEVTKAALLLARLMTKPSFSEGETVRGTPDAVPLQGALSLRDEDGDPHMVREDINH